MHVNRSREQEIIMSDQKVISFVFVATTASFEGDDSVHFDLEIPGVVSIPEFQVPLAAGGTGMWTGEANPADLSTVEEILSNDIILRVDNSPGLGAFQWAPASFYLLGIYESGQHVVICAIPDWPGDILGDDASEPGVADAIELNQFNAQRSDSPSSPPRSPTIDVS